MVELIVPQSFASRPTIRPRLVGQEGVRRCIPCYDHSGHFYPFCGPCFERGLFVVFERVSGIRPS
jgi:hypothetical protein